MAYDTPEPAYVFSGAAMVIGGLVFCLLPVFQQHKSNFTSFEKSTSSGSNPQSESAALLDVDISDLLTIKPLNNSQYIVTPTNGNHNVTDGHKIQMQCFIQQRDRQKQIILSKITEEKEVIRLDFNEIVNVAQKTKISDILSNNKDTTELNISIVPKDQLFSDVPLDNYQSNSTLR